jgi:hypothetical protein
LGCGHFARLGYYDKQEKKGESGRSCMTYRSLSRYAQNFTTGIFLKYPEDKILSITH